MPWTRGSQQRQNLSELTKVIYLTYISVSFYPILNLKFLIKLISIKKNYDFSSEKWYPDIFFFKILQATEIWLADLELSKPKKKLGKSQGSNQNHSPNPKLGKRCWSLNTRCCPGHSTVVDSGSSACTWPCFLCCTWNMNDVGPMLPAIKMNSHSCYLVY